MSRCANLDCEKDPLKSAEQIVVSCDGDFVCDSKCKIAHKKQKDNFFNSVIHNDDKFRQFMFGD